MVNPETFPGGGLDESATAVPSLATGADCSEDIGDVFGVDNDCPAVTGFQRIGLQAGGGCEIDRLGIRDRCVKTLLPTADEDFSPTSRAGSVDRCAVEQTDLVAQQMNGAAGFPALGIHCIDCGAQVQQPIATGVDLDITTIRINVCLL